MTTNKPRNTKQLSIDEEIILNLMIGCIKSLRLSKEEIINLTLSNFDDKSEKSKAKKMALEIYENYIEGEDYQQEIEKEAKFFKKIGWD